MDVIYIPTRASSLPSPTIKALPLPDNSMTDNEWNEYLRQAILSFCQIVWEEFDTNAQQQIFGEAGRMSLLDLEAATQECAKRQKGKTWVVEQLNSLLEKAPQY